MHCQNIGTWFGFVHYSMSKLGTEKMLDELVELCTMRIVGIARMGIHFGEGKYPSPPPPPPQPNQKIYIPSLHCYL